MKIKEILTANVQNAVHQRAKLRPCSWSSMLALLLMGICLFATSTVRAQSAITWNTPANIAGDSDVVTNGTLAYAYTESGQWTMVNGVSFASGTSATSLGGGVGGADVTMVNMGTSGGVDNSTYIGSNPAGLSSAYQTMVKGGVFNWGGGSPLAGTVTLNNLTSGHQYLVQYWVCDYRVFGSDFNRSVTLAAGNTSGSLGYLRNGGNISGNYVTGTFTASGTTQAITVTPGGPSPSAQMNAIQVRDLTPDPAPSQVTIYQDLFNDQQNINTGGSYTQSLATTAPTVRNTIAGGSASATWTYNAESGGWGQRDYNNNGVATPTSSNYLPFTPEAGHLYLLTATIDATAWGNGEWFTIAFAQSPGNFGGTGNLVWDAANNLVRGGQAKTISVTLDTRAPGWSNTQGLGYVGWVTDVAGQANLNASRQLTIDNFSLVIQYPCTNTYDANGATSGTAPVDGTIYSSNATVTVLGNTGTLAKAGYNFSGWNTAADGSGTTYTAGSAFTITGNTTLYARWISAASYTVTYDGNGSTSGSVPVDTNSYSSGATATVLGANTLVKTGNSFVNWNTAANGSGTSFNPSSTLTVVSNSVLYAQWGANQYTATYLAGAGGTISGTATQTVNYGTSTTSVTATPSAGYRFTGWSDAVATATRSDINFAANFSVTANFDNNLTWNNGAGTTNWNTTDTNWTGSVWNNGVTDNATFNNINYTVNLTEAITGGSLNYNCGDGTLHQLALAGSNLSLTNILVWGGYNASAGGAGVDSIGQAYGQRLAFQSITLTNTGDVSVKRGMVYVNSATLNVGGTIKNPDAWTVFREDDSVVTVVGGIDFSTIAAQVELRGGTVSTPFIKVGNAAFNGSGGLFLSGATVVPTQGSTDFLQVFNNGATNSRAAATIESAGVTFNTAYAVTIATVLQSAGGLTKAGSGTLTLSQGNTYTGNTVVSNGVLALSGSGSIASSANISIVGGATLDLTGLSATTSLNGNLTTGSGTLALAYNGSPAISSAGTVTLSGSTALSVNNTGSTLAHGSYKLIAKTGGGSVTGTLPSVTVTGNGAAESTGLFIANGELYLGVNANAPIAINTTNSAPSGGSVSISFNNGKYPLATDADGDALTITSVSASLGSVSTDGSSINYTNTSAGASDSITYTVSDGLGRTDTKTITVLLTSATGANLVSATAGEGNAYLSYLGVPGYNYALDKANSLTPPITWVPQVTNVATGQGVLNYTNALSLAPTNDFFRTRPVP